MAPQRSLEESSRLDAELAAEKAAAERAVEEEKERVAELSPEDAAAENEAQRIADEAEEEASKPLTLDVESAVEEDDPNEPKEPEVLATAALDLLSLICKVGSRLGRWVPVLYP